MKPLRHYSVPGTVGGAAPDLGMKEIEDSARDLTQPQLIVREALQNSHDARRDDINILDVSVVVVDRIDKKASDCLRDVVFADWPKDHGLGRKPRFGSTGAVTFRDEGTHGLTGPTDPGLAAPHGISARFRGFFHELGRDNSQAQGGGTHGIGRNALFALSARHLMAVFSHTSEGDVRFMAFSLLEAYDRGGRRYLGWHYWSNPDTPSAGAVPVEGSDALEIAQALGIVGDLETSTGTAIMILDPSPRDVSSEGGNSQSMEGLEAFVREMQRAAQDFALIPLRVDESLALSFELNGVRLD